MNPNAIPAFAFYAWVGFAVIVIVVSVDRFCRRWSLLERGFGWLERVMAGNTGNWPPDHWPDGQ